MWIFYNQKFTKQEEAFFPYNILNHFKNAVYQSFLIVNSQIIFAEESYFNLMATMRKCGLKIPMDFTVQYFSEIIEKLLDINGIYSAKAEFVVIKSIENKEIHLIASLIPAENSSFYKAQTFTLDIFKEIAIYPNFLEIQPIIHPENIAAKRYCQEHNLDDVIFLTNDKKIGRTLRGNLYFIIDNEIVAIDASNGSYKQAIDVEFQKFIKNSENYTFTFSTLSPFETQKMEEIFVSVEGEGFYSVKNIRQKEFSNRKTQKIIIDFQKVNLA